LPSKLGRATTITAALSGSGVPDPVTLTQTFDLADNCRRLAATLGTGSTTMADFVNQYTYDRVNRLTRVTQSGASGGNAVADKRVDFSYAADSQPAAAITRYQDLAGTKLVAASTFSYDPVGRLQGLSHRQNTTTLGSYTCSYDTANRVTAFHRRLASHRG
jgi:hypothetical protein